MSAIEGGGTNITAKRGKLFSFPEVTVSLYNWFQSIAKGTPGLTGNLLLKKAKDIAKQLGCTEDEASTIDINWINRFKNRRGSVAKKFHGEAASADENSVTSWRSESLPSIEQQFKHEDIFNSCFQERNLRGW